ncbi:glycosyl transferase [Clostridium polyendosporum]|uniref:Glycosyl transferase n=1 Tax=Clostridium polyendosporum TaxID=69208 RepID=A0A919VN56_9CLOT|nr:glycosyltransferase [Clostridium polyendosporum]GIM30243.1 glycosyl transferase [Clostridium polyendosporum]
MKYIPVISVVMSTYNERIEWIKKTIDSILIQTFSNFEFIIILDKPDNKELEDFILSYKDKRIIFVKNEKNLGLVKSLNKGISLAKGKYIARIDADDIAASNRLKEQYDFLENNIDIVLVGSNAYRIGENDEFLYYKKYLMEEDFFISKALNYRNIFFHPSLMYRTDIIKSIGCYRDIPLAEDYDLICRIIKSGYKVSNIDKPLISYRIRNNGISQSNLTKQKLMTSHVKYMYKNGLINKDTNHNMEDLSYNVNGVVNKVDDIKYKILKVIYILVKKFVYKN